MQYSARAINIETTNPAYFLESNCIFRSISQSGEGGSVRLISNINCVQRRFVVEQTKAIGDEYSSYGYFSIQKLENYENNLNYALEGSIFNSGIINNAQNAINFHQGKIIASYLNVSKCNALFRVALRFNIGSATNLLNYTTIEYNTVSSRDVVTFDSCNGKVYKCNVFNNKGNEFSGSIYAFGSKVTVEDCVFRGNSNNNKFTSLSDSIITIIHCNIDKLTTEGTVKTNDMKTKSFDINLAHFNEDMLARALKLLPKYECKTNIIFYQNLCPISQFFQTVVYIII